MSPWVIDAGPLIVWARAERLDLLEKLLPDGAIVTPAVYREAVQDAGDRPGALLIAKASWLQRVDAPELLVGLPAKLGHGEAEVLSLASQRELTAVVDEIVARREAARLGVGVVGSLWLIAEAKRLDLIDAAGPLVEQFLREGYRLDDLLIRRFLKRMEEA
jgi:predicted nucleic acid-binding protein